MASVCVMVVSARSSSTVSTKLVASLRITIFTFIISWQHNSTRKNVWEAKENLATATITAKKNSVALQTKILKGHPGKLISYFANQKKNGIDLIVIGSRDLGGIKEMFLGSVSNFVVHKSKVSTMVVK